MFNLIDIDLATEAHAQRTRNLEHRLALRETARSRGPAVPWRAEAPVPEWG